MSILHSDGFDQFTNLTGTTVATSLQAAGYEVSTVGTGFITIGDGAWANSSGVQIRQQNNAALSNISRTYPKSAYFAVGFAFFATDRQRIVSIKDVVDLEWTGRNVIVKGISGTAVPILNTWYYYEIEIDTAANELRLWINGYLDVTVPNFTIPSNVADLKVQFGWSAEETGGFNVTQRFDDYYAVDGSGAAPLNTRLTPIQINTRYPTEDVQKDWTPSVEGSDHWALVSKQPPEAASYIQSNESGALDLFKSSTPIAGSGTAVLAVGLVCRALKTDIDDRAIGLQIKNAAGANKEVLHSDMSTTYKYHYAFFDKDPSGTAWTKATAQEIQFGPVVRP